MFANKHSLPSFCFIVLCGAIALLPSFAHAATAAVPTLTVSASRLLVASGETSVLTWTSTGASTCTGYINGVAAGTLNGSGTYTTPKLTSTNTYALTCSNASGSTTKSVTVVVATGPATASLAASATSVAANATPTLTWSSTNATSCTASGGWSGTQATAGSYSLPALTASTIYNLTCSGPDGVSAVQSVAIDVVPVPTITGFTASAGSIASGGNVTLTWGATNATSCTASNGWTGAQAASGSLTLNTIVSTTTYALTCAGIGGTVVATPVTVTVVPAPTVTFSATPTSIASGATVTLTWASTNATSCTATGGWTGTQNANGTATINTVASTTTYALSCTGIGGTAVATPVTVTVVPAPTVTFSATPTSLTSGGTATVTWSSTNATSCTASGGWTGTQATAGTYTTPALTSTTTYALTCTGTGGTVTATPATVTVMAPLPTVSVTATQTTIANGATVTVNWLSTNATTCVGTINGVSAGTLPVTGSYTSPALTSTTVYAVACTNASGTTTKSLTVNVTPVATPAATASLTASATSVAAKATPTLTWSSTDATSCTASGGWSGALATSGTYTVPALTASTTFNLTCSGTGGVSPQQAVTITVTATTSVPTATLSASATSLVSGATATLTWSSTNATSCTASGGWTGAIATAGTYTTVAVNSTTATTTTYTLTCAGTGGTSAAQSVSITTAAALATKTTTSSPLAGTKLGVNLMWLADYDDNDMFVDAIKTSVGFGGINSTCSNYWSPSTCPVAVDANYWPTADFGVYVLTWRPDPVLGASYATRNPSALGVYSLSFTGKAAVNTEGGNYISNLQYNATTNVSTAQITVTASTGEVGLKFTSTQRCGSATAGCGAVSATNTGLTNVKLTRPGYAANTTQLFTTEFMNAIAPFSTLRFMQALNTITTPVADTTPGAAWAARTLPAMPSQSGAAGLSWEYVIALANASGKDIWINIPYNVDLTDTNPKTNYVSQLAALIQSNLTNPSVHVYVEFANEVWNGDYTYTATNRSTASAEVAAGDPMHLSVGQSNIYYQAQRRVMYQIVRISQLFSAAYGLPINQTPIRPVYMTQYGSPSYATDALNYANNPNGLPSALGITPNAINQYIYGIGGAPYFQANASASTTVDTTIASLTDDMNKNNMPGFLSVPAYHHDSTNTNPTFKEMADYYGLHTVLYEGGLDTSLVSSAALAEQANADPRINTLVQQELADFLGCGGDLFVYFDFQGALDDRFAAYTDLGSVANGTAPLPTPVNTALTTVTNTPLSDYTVCSSSINGSLYVH